MKKIFDWIHDHPTGGLIAMIALALLLAAGFVYSLFPKDADTADGEHLQANLRQVMPDAEEEQEQETSRLRAYIAGDPAQMNANDYWDSLGSDEEGIGDGGLVVTGPSDRMNAGISGSRYGGEYLDPSVYSELERYYITNNIKSRDQIDREHAERKAREEELGNRMSSSNSPQMSSDQRDSIYFARMERAYEMATRYSQPAVPVAEETEAEEQEEELRHIDLEPEGSTVEASFIDMNSFSDDGIITSLDEPSSGGVIHYNNIKVKAQPVKCTFLSTEKLVSGQRVIMRLMQDMILSDGTLIPVNTHITGTCQTGNRLKITVNAIHYGGKMFQTNIIAYDNDGTEGIYCPVQETKRNRQATKRVAGAAVGGTASAVLGAITGNPYLGRVASTGVSEVTRAIEDNGSISINVVSGYVFYLLESN